MKRIIKIMSLLYLALLFTGCDNQTSNQEERVFSEQFTLNSSFWDNRIKNVVVNFIPMTIDLLENDKSGWHSMDVFVQAGKKIRGEEYTMPIATTKEIHAWGDATVLNTVEAMCWALTIDAKGDKEIEDAQKLIKSKLETWIPLVEGAIKPDSYFSPQGTLFDWPYWESPKDNDLHEGYIFGYLLDCGIALYQATDGKDQRLYRASRKTADLWYESLTGGQHPDYQTYHPGVKQSLVRFGDFVETLDGKGSGQKYYALAKYLCDSRGQNGGSPYVMADKPVLSAKTIYGHTVCGIYLLDGLTEVTRVIPEIYKSDKNAMEAEFERHDSVATKLWDIMTNRKMYINGSCGALANEAFSDDFDLPTYSYSETCGTVANIILQNNRNLLHPDSRHHDILETALYNALLGAMDEAGLNWCYCNPLTNVRGGYEWANWHRRNYQEDCCMNNFTRILLQLPALMYSKNANSLRINQYIGSSFTVNDIAGTDVRVEQVTEYPDDGKISIRISPAATRNIKIYLRIPNRTISELYTPDIPIDGYTYLRVNGKDYVPVIEDGYALIERKWQEGDTIELGLPMSVQTFRAKEEVKAVRGRVAFQYGPFVFNIEKTDIDGKGPEEVVVDLSTTTMRQPVNAVFDKELMGGIWTLEGTLKDGSPFRAIPNFARMNRDVPGEYSVWIKEKL